MRITPHQFRAAYDVSVQVFDGKLTTGAGAQLLESRYGLNGNSARDFIYDYRQLMRGEVFRRAMSAPAMDYFLGRILADRGPLTLRVAIKAVRQHIQYYEKISGGNSKAMRAVVARHQGLPDVPASLGELEADFELRVRAALADSPARRTARLRHAAKLPVKVRTTVETYLRSADVVAEVLHRASGNCERCRRPAPFRRKSDGTPYLEVHHKMRLAEGGEDTVSNAMALCANCHREVHYGADPPSAQSPAGK